MRSSTLLPARMRPRRALAVALLALVGTVASLLAAVGAGRAEPARKPEVRWRAAGVTEVEPVRSPGHPTSVLDVRSDGDTPAVAAPAPEEPKVLAAYEGVELVEPSTQALAIGFHQAGGTHPGLTPVGRSQGNDNPDGTAAAEAPDGPRYRVLPSRGRGGPATSAVDVALPEGETVHSLVTGTVTAVNAYTLYGRLNDFLVEIEPEGRPDLRVMVLHVVDPAVAPGDRVVAGETAIAAGARPLPVRNQIDKYARSCPCPHVDVRVRRI